jgi:hypothetical protein
MTETSRGRPPQVGHFNTSISKTRRSKNPPARRGSKSSQSASQAVAPSPSKSWQAG